MIIIDYDCGLVWKGSKLLKWTLSKRDLLHSYGFVNRILNISPQEKFKVL